MRVGGGRVCACGGGGLYVRTRGVGRACACGGGEEVVCIHEGGWGWVVREICVRAHVVVKVVYVCACGWRGVVWAHEWPGELCVCVGGGYQ